MNLVDSLALFTAIFRYISHTSFVFLCHLLNAVEFRVVIFFACFSFFFFRFTLNLSLEKNSALRCLEFFNINSHTTSSSSSIKNCTYKTTTRWTNTHSFISAVRVYILSFWTNETQWKFQMEEYIYIEQTIENKNSSVRKFLSSMIVSTIWRTHRDSE